MSHQPEQRIIATVAPQHRHIPPLAMCASSTCADEATFIAQPRGAAALGEPWVADHGGRPESPAQLALRVPVSRSWSPEDADSIRGVALVPRHWPSLSGGSALERIHAAGRVVGSSVCWLQGSRTISAGCFAVPASIDTDQV